MREKKGNTVLLTIISVATLLVAVVGATFAYFTAVLSGQETDRTVRITSGIIGTVFDGGPLINLDVIWPKEEAWVDKKFSIKNTTTSVTKVDYDIALVVDYNDFTEGALKVTLEHDAESSSNGVMVPEVSMTSIPLSGVINLGAGYFMGPTGTESNPEVAHIYHLKIYFPETGENQNANQNAVFGGHITLPILAGQQVTVETTSP